MAPEAVEIDFGLPLDASEESRAMYRDLVNKWFVAKDADARTDQGESLTDVQRRFLPFVREIMNRHALDTGVVVIVAHSATLGYMVPMLTTKLFATGMHRGRVTRAVGRAGGSGRRSIAIPSW